MRPSTPRSIRRAISAGSLTVHGSTFKPELVRLAMRAVVALRQIRRPDRATRRLHETRQRAVVGVEIETRSPRRRTVAGRLHVVAVLGFGRQAAVGSSGASFFASTSVRQSNDCTVTRSATPASRTASTTRRAKVAGSTVSSGRVGRELGLEVEPHRLGDAP